MRKVLKLYVMCCLKLALLLQIDDFSYIAWQMVTNKIVIPMTVMKIKLSLRSVQLVQTQYK